MRIPNMFPTTYIVYYMCFTSLYLPPGLQMFFFVILVCVYEFLDVFLLSKENSKCEAFAMDIRIDYSLEKVVNVVIVIVYVFRHGRVIDENGRWPYEGPLGRRRRQQLERVIEDFVVPMLYVLCYSLVFQLIKFLTRIFRVYILKLPAEVPVNTPTP